MKKLISLVLCFVLLFVAVGCGASDSATNDAAHEATAQEVDIDLTELSATMVYSEVFNMMTACEDYVDKTINYIAERDSPCDSNDIKMSEVCMAYDTPYVHSDNVYSYIRQHIEEWVEEAIEIRNQYPK